MIAYTIMIVLMFNLYHVSLKKVTSNTHINHVNVYVCSEITGQTCDNVVDSVLDNVLDPQSTHKKELSL